MRAVAAELRHHAEITSRLLSETVGCELGALQAVRCEAAEHGNVDLLLSFAGGVVGIEGKIGHSVGEAQTAAECATLALPLVFLVKEEADVPACLRTDAVRVLTWESLLGALPDARITLADINAVCDMNRIARRALAACGAECVPAGWSFTESPTASGFPSRASRSPELPCGRQVRVQLEADRARTGRFVASIALSVEPTDFDEGCLVGDVEPDWITQLRRFGPLVEAAASEQGVAMGRHDGVGRTGAARVKVEAARRFGLDLRWATGYTTSYVGLRTAPIQAGDVADAWAGIIAVAQTAYEGMLAASPHA